MAEYKQKGNTPCACGDEAHEDLEDWYESYLGSRERLLLEDKFDEATLEKKIQELSPLVPISNGYCPNCQKLLDEWSGIIKKVPEYVLDDESDEPYQQPHFKGTLELETGHRNGCLLCTLFVQCSIARGYSLENWHRKENRLICLGKSTQILVTVSSAEGYFLLTLTWPGLDNDCWFPTNPLYCIKETDQQLFKAGMEATRLTSHRDISQLELAKKWLDGCLETHEFCKPIEDYQLPTRLIDLGSTPIRLVQSSELATKPRYATLSHCWGTQDFYKLEQDNLKDFMTAIPEEKLTKTFQDAIYITRSLNLRYLWIDCLCIIQCCDPDWRIESALMGSIYGGSTITIAATGATDGTKGCFLRPPGYISKIHIKLTTGDVWDIAPGKFYYSVLKSPLGDRAWAVQERFLSPRTLHFSTTDLFWECRQRDASESFPEGSPEFDHGNMFHRDWKLISENWDTIISSYTGSKLAFPSDKLVAISGLAQRAFKENGDQYLAGLWRRDIEFQLLWCQVHPGTRLLPGSKYRAPSWSWASVDDKGYVYYSPRHEGFEYVYYAHVLSANVVPVGKELFGELKGGELQMSFSVMLVGQLKTRKGHFGYFDSEVEINSLDNSTESFPVYPDSNELDGRDVYLVPVLETLGKGKHDKRGLKGLILLPTGCKKGEYSRAGHFSCLDFDEAYRKSQDRFRKLLEASGKATAESQCAKVLEEPQFEKERFAITIIYRLIQRPSPAEMPTLPANGQTAIRQPDRSHAVA
ncbi:hypothetical protein V492_04458 [Pseudogymnoascus sp. VKM F-4246]|nr:hypothetical protein V492_04458 [Pseudogymnoascus sp. VKM F-4246]